KIAPRDAELRIQRDGVAVRILGAIELTGALVEHTDVVVQVGVSRIAIESARVKLLRAIDIAAPLRSQRLLEKRPRVSSRLIFHCDPERAGRPWRRNYRGRGVSRDDSS